MYPKDIKYTKTHEWLKPEDGKACLKAGSQARVGITDYAQEQLGDVVFVELPRVGKIVAKGEGFGVIESFKAAYDLYAPVSGEVVEVNEKLNEAPELVNQDPYGQGWMMILEISNASEIEDLLTAEEYERFVKESSHSG